MIVTCTRPSTVAKALDATGDGLMDYHAATVLQSVMSNTDLLDAARMVRGSHWRSYKHVVTEAKARRGKREASDGTNIHSAVSMIVNGEDLDGVPESVMIPAQLVVKELADIGVTVAHSERFVANLDRWDEPVAGTTDLVLEYDGSYYIGDIKSTEEVGRNTRFAAMAWVIQMTCYAHGAPYPVGYEPRRDQWGRPIVDSSKEMSWGTCMDTSTGIVLEVARDGSGVASHELDLDSDLVALAMRVRAVRKEDRLG